jgi:ribosome-binding protein aMBF1 (putative translation factor)
MIDFDLFARIKNYHEQKGLSATQIARELELDPPLCVNITETPSPR